MRRLLLTISIAAMLAGCGSGPSSVRAAIKPVSARKQAPDFELKDSTGKVVKLSDFKGKVVLLNFWATWCGPCKIEIPWFVEFEQNYKDKGFVVLGVSMDEEGWEIVKPFIEKHKINYRLVIGDDATAQKYGGVDSLPTSFLIDRQGRTAAVHIGLVSKGNYVSDITQLLDGSGAGSGAKGAD
ncbi:MAG: TlpA family protein disulfide reductase [Acidobacteria bacterium]|nr:TlpA family protein disulfide reductase [Acidobacteriota bacterium]